MLDDLVDIIDCLVTGRTSLSIKTKLQFCRKRLYPKIHASMIWVTDLLVGGGSYRLHRSGREASRLVLLHGVARFQLVLVSQSTVATILGLHSRGGTG